MEDTPATVAAADASWWSGEDGEENGHEELVALKTKGLHEMEEHCIDERDVAWGAGRVDVEGEYAEGAKQVVGVEEVEGAELKQR
jgi:hypothetical protein